MKHENIIINYYLAINTIHRAIKLKMFYEVKILYICICIIRISKKYNLTYKKYYEL